MNGSLGNMHVARYHLFGLLICGGQGKLTSDMKKTVLCRDVRCVSPGYREDG